MCKGVKIVKVGAYVKFGINEHVPIGDGGSFRELRLMFLEFITSL